MQLSKEHRLAILLHTAAMWHSDHEGGINLLSLSSTRMVHNHDHRAGLLAEIKADIVYCLSRDDVAEATKDIGKLANLMAKVAMTPIGQEWLTDQENLSLNEELFQKGMI